MDTVHAPLIVFIDRRHGVATIRVCDSMFALPEIKPLLIDNIAIHKRLSIIYTVIEDCCSVVIAVYSLCDAFVHLKLYSVQTSELPDSM